VSSGLRPSGIQHGATWICPDITHSSASFVAEERSELLSALEPREREPKFSRVAVGRVRFAQPSESALSPRETVRNEGNVAHVNPPQTTRPSRAKL